MNVRQFSARVDGASDQLEIAVKGGRWVLCHVPARPAAPKPVLHYFHDDE